MLMQPNFFFKFEIVQEYRKVSRRSKEQPYTCYGALCCDTSTSSLHTLWSEPHTSPQRRMGLLVLSFFPKSHALIFFCFSHTDSTPLQEPQPHWQYPSSRSQVKSLKRHPIKCAPLKSTFKPSWLHKWIWKGDEHLLKKTSQLRRRYYTFSLLWLKEYLPNTCTQIHRGSYLTGFYIAEPQWLKCSLKQYKNHNTHIKVGHL